MSAKPLFQTRHFAKRATARLLIVILGLQPLAQAKAQANSNGLLNLFEAPFLAGQSIPPYVMLTMTKDQQLFKKAYDDYSDLDGDNVLDTSYKHSFDYYGYFDSKKCYDYVEGSRRFEPSSITSNKYCSGNWSGNFLNWATMTRMDALRKVLYGGLRSPDRGSDGGDGANISDGDSNTSTVLERAYLPTDSHAFSKYYNGDDLNQLTPYSVPVPIVESAIVTDVGRWSTNQDIDSSPKVVRLPRSNENNFVPNDIVELSFGSGANKKFVRGTIGDTRTRNGFYYIRIEDVSELNSSGFGTAGNPITNPSNVWTLTNLSRQGLTLCNTTDGGDGAQGLSNTNTNLPKIKVIPGNYSLWNASERWQCTWAEQRRASNSNVYANSGIPAYSVSPSRGETNLDYFVRVQVCVDGKIGQEKCKRYPNPSPTGTVKPIGLLQSFGETDRIRFGLMTGSFQKNLAGGVLRKNIGKLDDEIELTTGKFKLLGDSGVGPSVSPGNPSYNMSGGSIIKMLSGLRMMGYRYSDGNLFNNNGNTGTNDNCSYQTELDTNGKCKSWGNPISEIFYETLRYFGGKTTPTNAFDADDTTVRADLVKASWPSDSSAVLSESNYCAPLNALVINGATSTNENESTEEISDLSFMSGSPGSAKALTTDVGAKFGLTGTYYYGHKTSDAPGTPGYRSCSAKALSGLGDVVGICPEGPTYGGTYKIAGLAYHAHTNAVNNALASNPEIASRILTGKHKHAPLKVDTYAVSLSSGVPRIPIKFAGDSKPRATLQPAYRLITGSGRPMGGALVDVRVLSQTETADRSTGRMMVSWEDSEGGGDYDMDMWGTFDYVLYKEGGVAKLKVTTTAVSQATANPQGFGYIISGTNADGQHYHSGILNFNFDDTNTNMSVTPVIVNGETRVNAGGDCTNCNVGDGPSTATYTIVDNNTAKDLREPLWYAAAFGGFDDKEKTGLPGTESDTAKFDSLNNGTGLQGADGIPDNFFKVSNPSALESSLERAFQNIAAQSSLTNVASASTRVKAGNRIYEAKFNSGDWSGEVIARATNARGLFVSGNSWSTTASMADVNEGTRVVITQNSTSKVGVPFRWDSISAAQRAALNKTPSDSVDSFGPNRLRYLRGSDTDEGFGTNNLRARTVSKLGDIVNSNPVFVGKPEDGNLSNNYAAFANTARTPVVYVGANDGMLHGFNADTGKEVLAYVPAKVRNRLAHITRQEFNGSHKYTVDGQIGVQDVFMGGAWQTMLVGALGKGGNGVYALNVTNPSSFSEANAASITKWEFTDEDDAALGYVYSEPLIRKMPNGKWAALVTSGYNVTESDGHVPSSGTGHLFVLFLEGPTGPGKTWIEGTDYVKIPLGSDTLASANHVGGVATWDVESDGIVDYAYMGDIKGRMWRVKFSGASPSGWTGSAMVLFNASYGTTEQPITAAPNLTNGPLYQGVLVVFGTGQLMQQADLLRANYKTQSMYGVLDRFDRTTPIPRSDLMPQKIFASTDLNGANFSLLSAYQPNYTDTVRTNVVWGNKAFATGPTATTPPQRGWMFDMTNGPTDGERNLFSPVISGDLLVFANALPSAIACDGGGDETRYVLSIMTGGRYWRGGFDTTGDNNITTADKDSFNNFEAGSNGQSTKFFASRRLKKGGYGQINALEKIDKSASSPDGVCVRALAYSTAGEQPEVLPGGCVNRVQWRESLNLSNGAP
jgi:type IV pilus assembly protein PilY1